MRMGVGTGGTPVGRGTAGTAVVRDAIRQVLEPVLESQTEHAVWPKVEVLWDRPYDMGAVWMRQGGEVVRGTPDEVVARCEERRQTIHDENDDPLRWSCEPDIWRQIDLQVARKRLECPGLVLEVLVTGGMRPGKTEGCTRRAMANFLWTPKSWAWFLHQTDITSRTIQQKRVERMLPPELNPESGRMRKDKHTKFNYTAGTGFTGAMFQIEWECQDENGRKFIGGGECDFRFYKQDLDTFQGAELTCATSDELIPLNIAKTVVQRLSTRAADTAKPEFLGRIRKAIEMLERGERLPMALLGAIYHSVHLISFTPADGWTATVSRFLDGAEKYGWVEAELLVGAPGVEDPRVPRFAQPQARTQLVAYLHTKDNVIKPAYPAIKALLEGKTEEEIRIVAYGDVGKDWKTQFSDYKEERHVKDWTLAPEMGTIYEILDPGGRKPWVYMMILCDIFGRHWILQEWPCPGIMIEGKGMPGPWAIASETEKRNGDPGPAQLMRLGWTRAHWTRLIWQMRARLLEKYKAAGKTFRGRILTQELSWEGRPEWRLTGPFSEVFESIMDPRFAKQPAEHNKVQTTVGAALGMEENAIHVEVPTGDPIATSDILIQQALAEDIDGLPGLIVMKDCENTRFMFKTYSLPEYKEDTKATDEACKDFRDPIAYYLLRDPVYVDVERWQQESGGDEGGGAY